MRDSSSKQRVTIVGSTTEGKGRGGVLRETKGKKAKSIGRGFIIEGHLQSTKKALSGAGKSHREKKLILCEHGDKKGREAS